LAIDPYRGAVSIGGQPELMFGGSGFDSVQSALGPFVSGENEWKRDGHVYHRIECALGDQQNHLTFGNWRCGFVATLQDARLSLLYWQLWPPKGSHWPAGGATEDDQMWVLVNTLRTQLSRPFNDHSEYFDWGYAWCGPELHTNDPLARISYRDPGSSLHG
jgi:hypothetical protein